MAGADLKEDLARVCRVLAHHRMIDLRGHLSLRAAGSDRVLATPRFSKHCLPRGVAATEVLACDATGRVLEGRGQAPAGLAADLALYSADTTRRACIFAAPQTAMAAAIAGYELKPLTHMESATVFDPSSIVHEPGIGVRATGKDIHECLAKLYHLEYLAQVNLVVAGDAGTRTISREDSDKIWRQFAGHHHYHEFFASLDPGPQAHPYTKFLERHPDDPLKAALAFSCRALWERGTLVAFLEHISHRAPDGKHFFMTASKNYRDMEPGDVCVLDYEANSVAGPRPPGFKWFHAQLLRERQDVLAVVHTHDVYGRAYALSPRKLVPCYRVGLDIAMRPLPTYGRCDLIVDPEVRRQTLDALADGPVVHEIGHGTDFVADSLEKATMDAIQREAFLEMDALTRRFGTPKPLSEEKVLALQKSEPTPQDWWWFYAAEVGAPKRSAAGL
jgi:L-fuculose-phosphate aldolase